MRYIYDTVVIGAIGNNFAGGTECPDLPLRSFAGCPWERFIEILLRG
jgi:hypothetical protein